MEFPETAQEHANDENAMENWVAIRDSKDPAGPVLFLVEDEWRVFVRRIKSGHYDPD